MTRICGVDEVFTHVLRGYTNDECNDVIARLRHRKGGCVLGSEFTVISRRMLGIMTFGIGRLINLIATNSAVALFRYSSVWPVPPCPRGFTYSNVSRRPISTSFSFRIACGPWAPLLASDFLGVPPCLGSLLLAQPILPGALSQWKIFLLIVRLRLAWMSEL